MQVHDFLLLREAPGLVPHGSGVDLQQGAAGARGGGGWSASASEGGSAGGSAGGSGDSEDVRHENRAKGWLRKSGSHSDLKLLESVQEETAALFPVRPAAPALPACARA